MKLLLKIFKIIALVIILLSITLISVTLIKEDKVASIFLNELNKNINTKVEVGSSKLSLFRKFPMASFEFKNILIHSSYSFDKRIFNGADTDTLLYAKALSLEFKMTDIYKGKYIIESINISNGKMTLLSDKFGMTNYEITDESIDSTGNEFALNLKNIALINMDLFYFNNAIPLNIKSRLKSGRLRGEIAGKNIDLYAKSDGVVTQFQLYDAIVTHPTDIEFELNMHKSDSGILFKKGTLSFENIGLGLTGTIADKNVIDIALSGQSTNISGLKNYLSGRYLTLFEDYKPSGILKLDCKITGTVSKTVSPHIDINFGLEKGKIEYARSKISADNISFSGTFNNGKKNNPESSNLIITKYFFNIGTSNYTGSSTLQNFINPQIDLMLHGMLVFSDLKDFISLPQISSSEGSVDASIRLSGLLEKKEKYSFSDLLSLNPEANLTFNSFSIGLNNEKIKINDVDGNIKYLKNVWTDNLFMTFKDQRIKLDGEFVNLPEWLSGQPIILKVTADVNFDKLNPATFFENEKTNANGKPIAYNLPDDILLDINLKIGNFEYKTFSSKNFSGRMTYKPKIVEITDFQLSAVSGNISGNCFLTQNLNKSFITKGTFDLKQVNINQAFTSFQNFGQTYLKAENIDGSLSGTCTILLTLDSNLNPDLNSWVVEGKFSLKDGQLIDFEPVKELSSYIELSELENIKFSNLENELFIRNAALTIPQMEIKSSAADLSINGKHYFSGDYEYHVKILLSELLSKKKRNSKNPAKANTEFGVVEDDGLGRTSLLLKITQVNSDVNVGYDFEAAKGRIKQDFNTEKKNLKTILNEEYGWYKEDSATLQKPAAIETPEKPRFRITFEDTDL